MEEFHAVTRPGILDSITIDADFDEETSIYDTYFYLNGVDIYPEEVLDYVDGTYDIVFDTGNNPIFLEPGDVLAFEIVGESVPSYMDINTYILEGQI